LLRPSGEPSFIELVVFMDVGGAPPMCYQLFQEGEASTLRPPKCDLARGALNASCSGWLHRRSTMFQTATSALDWLGIIAFTVTGALVASRKEMDVVGFVVLGTVTGVGGGERCGTCCSDCPSSGSANPPI
jgi:hypothetical protein